MSAPPREHLPSGRHGLTPEYVAAHQRERLLRAMCECCAARGYAATTIGHIVGAAGVSRRAFYSHFADKEGCLLAACGARQEELWAGVAAELSELAPEWPERVGAGLRAVLRQLAAHPEVAGTLLVETLRAGPGALSFRERTLERCRRLLPLPQGAPGEAPEAVLGGVVDLVCQAIVSGRLGELEDMWEELLYCLLAPLVGHERTLRACAWVALPSAASG